MVKRKYRTVPTVGCSICSGCGALVACESTHNQWHWNLDPETELVVGDEVYVRNWGIGTEDGRTVCQKVTVSGLDDSLVRVDQSGRTYYFEYEDVFPADPAYGFDPYWSEEETP